MSKDTLCDVRSWTSYEHDEEKESKFQTIIKSFDQQVLIEACKEARKSNDMDIDCAIQPHWAMGTRNLILEARFSDGIRWVLKINMLDESDKNINEDKIYGILQLEFAAMEFIRIHTKLPIPTPHFIIRLPTSLGPTACLAMDLVRGITGDCFFESHLAERSSKTRAKLHKVQQRVLRSMADIQITLAQFQAPIWGCLRKSPCPGCECYEVDGFENRSIVDGFVVAGGPSDRTARGFYSSMIAERAKYLDTIDDEDLEEYTSSARKILDTIRENLSICCNNDDDPRPRFYLTNVDLGPRNAIFDIRGSLQAVIDVDMLQFVPIDYAVQPPPGLGLEFFAASETTVWRAGDNESGGQRALIEQYGECLSAAGHRLGLPNLGSHFRAQLLKDPVPLIQGLQVVDEEDTDYSNGWLGSEAVLRLTDQNAR